MKKYIIAVLAALSIIGCSEDHPKSDSAPTEYKKREVLEMNVDLWSPKGVGQPSKMKFENSEGGIMVLRNNADPGPNIYLTLAKLVSGLKPNTTHEIRALVWNEGDSYLLFITTDPDWDKRTMCIAEPEKWTVFTHKAKSDANGDLTVRLVCEKKGTVAIRDIQVEAME